MQSIVGIGKRCFNLFSLSAAVLTSGCATVDRFGERATTYNRQMQITRDTEILENILRSGYGLPLQFSEVSTVTGTGSAQGALGSSLPFAGVKDTFSLSPSLQASGGPSFTVSNLNNQEFFNGITTPISPDIVVNYVGNGSTRLQMLLLTVADIDYDAGGVHHHFEGDATDPDRFASFASVLGNMIRSRLSFESKSTTSYIGRPYLSREVSDSRMLASLVAASATDGTATLEHYERSSKTDADAFDALTDADKRYLAAAKADDFYRLAKTTKKVQPCFLPEPASTAFGDTYPSDVPGKTFDFPIGGNPTERMAIGPEEQCKASVSKQTPGTIEHLIITFRSVRGVYDFLGKLSRYQLDCAQSGRCPAPESLPLPPAGQTPPPNFNCMRPASKFDVPTGDGHGDCYRLIGVEFDPDAPASIFPNQHVRLSSFDAYDLSYSSVQILSELMALYSSAKSLPSPSVIPFVTR